MNMLTSLNKARHLPQADHLWQILLAAFAAALFVTGMIFLWGRSTGIPLTRLSGDPASVTRTPMTVGILSNLGVLLWAGATTSAFLGAALQAKKALRFWFLLASGVLSALLTLDDQLLFHERILTRYLPEVVGYLIYLLLIGLYLVLFVKEIRSDTLYPILVVSLLFMGLSVTLTKIIPYSVPLGFLKDCLKFFGIVYWFAYFFNTAVRFVREDRRLADQ